MKVKHKVSLALALLLAINIVPGRVDASQVMEEMPKQETMSEEKDVENPISLSDEATQDDETKAFEEKVAKAKEELKKYLDSMDEESVDNPAIAYEGQTKEDIKKAIARAKELLADESIDQAKLEEMEKIPFKKVDGKKQGLFRDYTHKALVNFEVVGERTNKNPHNNKAYVGLRDNKIKIKSSFKGLKKSGESKNKFIKLNYVTEADYQAMKLDGVSAATPKYKKQELPQDDYIIREVEDGYEIEITKLPADAKFIKPVALVKFADGTYFENGDIVYVKNEKSSAKPAKAEKVDQKSGATEKASEKKEEKLSSKKAKEVKKADSTSEATKKDKKEEAKVGAKAAAKNAKTGVASSIAAILTLGASSTALFASKKRK
ncbi:sortase [Anaerococcus murdochii]|uniref:Sortase n=1 Tax=Anaerococcus murdochii TaxID=411577 RepID=A0ABS7SY81_9FIRM|nr:sortase [Anaerococcus murdochii]MBZ2386502.1 sortase [Anaerococcus murdochii]